jgi:hypothetical protein
MIYSLEYTDDLPEGFSGWAMRIFEDLIFS